MVMNEQKKLCECGCGEQTKIITHTNNKKGQKKGGYHKFLIGHARRGRSLTKTHKTNIGKANFKGGRILRRGYIYISKPDHPRVAKAGYVSEQRLVMEKYLGRYLNKKEVVHHVDRNIKNNKLSNLKLFSDQGAHARFHYINKDSRLKNMKGGKNKNGKNNFNNRNQT